MPNGRQVREEIIAINGETAAQPGIGPAIPLVGDEARRGVAFRPQEFGQRGIGGVERSVPAGGELCGHRPVNMVAWDGSVHDAAACAASNRIPRRASSSIVGLVGRL